jgi:hypothetical protein
VCASENMINLGIHNVCIHLDLFLALDAHKKNEVKNFYESRGKKEKKTTTILNHDDFLAMAHSNASYK